MLKFSTKRFVVFEIRLITHSLTIIAKIVFTIKKADNLNPPKSMTVISVRSKISKKSIIAIITIINYGDWLPDITVRILNENQIILNCAIDKITLTFNSHVIEIA